MTPECTIAGPCGPAPTGTEARVCDDIAKRQALGVAKYGTTVEANPLTQREWLQHAYEEGLDQCVYLRRLIEEIDNQQRVKQAAKAMLNARQMSSSWRRALIKWTKKNGSLTILEREAAEAAAMEAWKQWRNATDRPDGHHIPEARNPALTAVTHDDPFLQHEVMDRSAILLAMLDRSLGGHPGVAHRRMQKMYDRAERALANLYQEAARVAAEGHHS